MNSNLDNVLDAALAIAVERRRVIKQLRAALDSKDPAAIEELARQVCGLYSEQPNAKRTPTDQGIH